MLLHLVLFVACIGLYFGCNLAQSDEGVSSSSSLERKITFTNNLHEDVEVTTPLMPLYESHHHSF